MLLREIECVNAFMKIVLISPVGGSVVSCQHFQENIYLQERNKTLDFFSIECYVCHVSTRSCGPGLKIRLLPILYTTSKPVLPSSFKRMWDNFQAPHRLLNKTWRHSVLISMPLCKEWHKGPRWSRAKPWLTRVNNTCYLHLTKQLSWRPWLDVKQFIL
jgi:hypothetical protein